MPVFHAHRGAARDLGGFSGASCSASMRVVSSGPFIFWDHMGRRARSGHGMDVRPTPHQPRDGDVPSSRVRSYTRTAWAPTRPSALETELDDGGSRDRALGAHRRRATQDRRSRTRDTELGRPSQRSLEETEPAFQHVDGKLLPELDDNGARLRVIAGTAFGATAPVQVMSPTFYVEARLKARGRAHAPRGLRGARRVRRRGRHRVRRADRPVGTMGNRRRRRARDDPSPAARTSDALGGAPVGPRHIWWNFVSSSEERIERAKREWKGGAFRGCPETTSSSSPAGVADFSLSLDRSTCRESVKL